MVALGHDVVLAPEFLASLPDNLASVTSILIVLMHYINAWRINNWMVLSKSQTTKTIITMKMFLRHVPQDLLGFSGEFLLHFKTLNNTSL